MILLPIDNIGNLMTTNFRQPPHYGFLKLELFSISSQEDNSYTSKVKKPFQVPCLHITSLSLVISSGLLSETISPPSFFTRRISKIQQTVGLLAPSSSYPGPFLFCPKNHEFRNSGHCWYACSIRTEVCWLA